jgi:hypothetical protein
MANFCPEIKNDPVDMAQIVLDRARGKSLSHRHSRIAGGVIDVGNYPELALKTIIVPHC